MANRIVLNETSYHGSGAIKEKAAALARDGQEVDNISKKVDKAIEAQTLDQLVSNSKQFS